MYIHERDYVIAMYIISTGWLSFVSIYLQRSAILQYNKSIKLIKLYNTPIHVKASDNIIILQQQYFY